VIIKDTLIKYLINKPLKLKIMATKNFGQMTTKRLNALLETSSNEDKKLIELELNARAEAQANVPITAQEESYESEVPLTAEEQKILDEAEKNGGINPLATGRVSGAEKAKKMSDEDLKKLAEELKVNVGHKCQVVPFNTVEWVGGIIAGIVEEKRSNKVLYAIKTDDGRRIVKTYDSPLIKILEETVEIVKAVRGKKAKDQNAVVEEKVSWTPEEIEDAITETVGNVGKNISYPKFLITEKPVEGEEAQIEHGRIVSLVPDKRGKRVLFRIELDQTEDEVENKLPKKYAHKVSTNPDLTVAEDFDEIGLKINEAFVSRRKNAGERIPLTPQRKVELAEQSFEAAKKALEKAQEAIGKREKALQDAKDELAKFLDAELGGLTGEPVKETGEPVKETEEAE